MVTGGNKGVGYEVVKQLAEKGITVILTARDERRGSVAAGQLHSAGLVNVLFRCLDVGNRESIRTFAEWLKQEHGGLDILVSFFCMLACAMICDDWAECRCMHACHFFFFCVKVGRLGFLVGEQRGYPILWSGQVFVSKCGKRVQRELLGNSFAHP